MGNRDVGTKAGNRKRHIWTAAAVVLLCAAAVSGAVWGWQAYREHRAEEKLEELAAQADKGAEGEIKGTADPKTYPALPSREPEKDPLGKLADMGIPIPDKTVDLAALQEEINEDIYAWIYIPDSAIDYPVLQHPTDNSYYLNYNIDGSKGLPGCIYSETYNQKDFSDPNTVLYGHNMRNGSMFAGLHRYEDSQYFTEHPYVYLYTEKGLLAYRIFAAYQTDNSHILLSWDFSDADEFGRYLANIFQIRSMTANIDNEAEVTQEDRILTLSTCVSNQPDCRYLVQGVLLNEE